MALPTEIAKSLARQGTSLLTTGQRFRRFDQVRQRHFWSKCRIPPDGNGFALSGTYELFQTPVGQVGQGMPLALTPLETNWPSANRVPDNINLIITEFGVTPRFVLSALEQPEVISDIGWAFINVPNIPTHNIAQVMDSASLNITYLTNSISLGLLSDFAQASGPQNNFYNISVANVYPPPPFGEDIGLSWIDGLRPLYTNGFPAPALRRKLKVPILLQHGEQFRMNITLDAGRGNYLDYLPAYDFGEQIPWAQLIQLEFRVDFWATESFVEKG